jgi:hypothetical protein
MSALPSHGSTPPVARVLSQANVRLVTDPIRVGMRTPPTHAHDPVVNITRRGERVQQIEVRCACGQVVIIDCEY